MAYRKSLLVGLVLLLGGMGAAALLPLGYAGDDPKPAPAFVKGVVYKVFYGDSMHNMGVHLKEVFLPDRGFSFALVGGEVQVLRPERTRYQVGGTTTIDGWNGPDGKPVEIPYFNLRDQEPRLVGEIQVRREDADRFEAFLKTKEQLAAVAQRYFPTDDTPRVVATWKSGNEKAYGLVRERLDLRGLQYSVTEVAGVMNLSVAPNMASTVRDILNSEVSGTTDGGVNAKGGSPGPDFKVIPAKDDGN